jgi:hypothetical protein
LAYFITGSCNKVGGDNAQGHNILFRGRRRDVCRGRNGVRRPAVARRDLQGRRQKNLTGIENPLPRGSSMRLLRLLLRGSLQLRMPCYFGSVSYSKFDRSANVTISAEINTLKRGSGKQSL